MFEESVFMIRGGSFGDDFTRKFFLTLVGIFICVFDYKTRNKRKDYFWVWITGAIIWSFAEFLLQMRGARIYKTKYFFGLDVTNALWLTIPLQGMSEGALVGVFGMLFGDRLLNKATRRNWSIIYLCVLLSLIPVYFYNGTISYNNVNAGDPDISSRRDMFPFLANLFCFILSVIPIIWYFTTGPVARKRGLLMYIIMASYVAWWTLIEWLVGQRWIEVGTVNSDGSFSNLKRASALVEFGALAYDYMIEVSLIYVPFLSIPYWLNLIKTK